MLFIKFVFVGQNCYMCIENALLADIFSRFNNHDNCNNFLFEFQRTLCYVRCNALMEFAIFKCCRHLAVLPTDRLC